MSVRVQLDNPNAFYTNLDYLSGKVILTLTSDETVSAIVVKLEGESKTLLIKPPPQYDASRPTREDRNRIAMEMHKILYKVQTVFPPAAGAGPSAAGASFTMRAGHHEYPFRFKIPFNNMCGDKSMLAVGPGLGGRLGLIDLQQYQHVHKTLPPSLSGFPGEAEIRYYVKVTVQRPSIWKENRRSAVGFKFMPIEPPRPPPSNAEAFARRAHEFKAGMFANQRKKGIFGRTPKPLSSTPPSVLVDARLPSPSILVCRQPLPMRIIIKRNNDSPESVFLVGLEVDLIGTTEVRAQNILRHEHSTFPILNLHGLNRPIGEPGEKSGTETPVDETLWDRIPLPPTVTPSFHTCNLTRTYELAVRVTIGYGVPGDIQPQTQVVPLRFPVEVFSGIKPPPELLDAVLTSATRPSPVTTASAPMVPPRPGGVAAPAPDPLYPPQLGTAPANLIGEAPPSYEDAMADDIGPLDGRRDYSGVTDENAPSEVGEKGSGAVPGYTAQAGGRS